MNKKTNSTDSSVKTLGRLKYLFQLVRMNLKTLPITAQQSYKDVKEVAKKFEKLTSKRAKLSVILEIGFGARPYKAFAFQTVFREVIAVDLDQPVFGISDFPLAVYKNGFFRAIKAIVRNNIFYPNEWQTFHAEMKKIYKHYDPKNTNLVVSDACKKDFWNMLDNTKVDFVYSVDVFEHIPRCDLKKLLINLRDKVTPETLIIIIPNVFTGIIGGHDPKWYRHKVDTNQSQDAWSHLLDSNYNIDTYLNRMSRREYKSLFLECGFRIISDISLDGQLGKKHLNKDLEERLKKFDHYELFSNRVEFILKIN